MKPTKYQDLIITELMCWTNSYLELKRKKNGVWVHTFVGMNGIRKIIRNDTSKSVQWFLKSKIKVIR